MVLGGIGNPYGVLVGALVIGVTSEVSTQWINPSYKPAVAFFIMIAMLLARPREYWGTPSEGSGDMDLGSIANFAAGFIVMAGIYSVFALGLNVHWGFTGLFNIGIAGFFALGA